MAKTAASILAGLIIIQREHDRSNLNLGINVSCIVKTSLASFFQQDNKKLNHFPFFDSNGCISYSLVFL